MLPDWFKNAEINAGGVIPEWCYTILTWHTVFEAGGGSNGWDANGANEAINTRVQVRNLRVYILWQTATGSHWTLVDNKEAPAVDLWKYPFNALDWRQFPSGVRSEATREGGNSIKPAAPYFHHGYGTGKYIANPWDVAAVFVAMDFRLVVDDINKADDRHKAKYVVDVGADYYPPNSGWKVGYAPGVGNGRYLLATNDWRTASMLVPNRLKGVSLDSLLVNQPALPLSLTP